MSAEHDNGCIDIDGIRVRIIEHAYCANCGAPALWTSTGWHHDHVVGVPE